MNSHQRTAGLKQNNTAQIEQAATWMARLLADDACDQDRINCKRWRDQHPANEQAWQLMCQVSARFSAVPSGSGLSTVLGQAHQAVSTRRRFLKTLSLAGLGVGIASLSVPHTSVGRAMLAGYRTGIGEIKTFQLEDGTLLTLNTDTAVDVSFSAHQRLIRLHQGEIQLKTGVEIPRRHFVVQTDIGDIVALGTEFTLRQHKGHIHLAVLEGAVEARPAQNNNQAQRLDAGQQARFNQHHVTTPQPLSINSTRWRDGKLVAQGMRLADFVEEIARYRPGFTLYDEALADLTISGVFSLTDTDRALESLAASLPVALSYRTRYWVKVVPTAPE